MSDDPFNIDAITHVLLATNGSDEADRAAVWAKGIARFWEAKVTVLSAYDSPKAMRKRTSLLLPQIREELAREARELVAEVVADLRQAGIDADGVAYEGTPVDAILETAEQTGADLVVLGGGSPSGPRDYLVGSTAERVVRHAKVPVFVVR
jgi:nucleotide-binding universal stress UspA family protein